MIRRRAFVFAQPLLGIAHASRDPGRAHAERRGACDIGTETVTDVKDLFGFRFEDFTLRDYDPAPHIKAAVSV